MQEKNDKNFDAVKLRMLNYIEKEGITKTKFYQQIGLSQSNFAGIGLKSELKTSNLIKFLSVYNNVSIKWLLFGEGQMLNSDSIQQNIDTNTTENAEILKLTAKLEYTKELLEEKDEQIRQLKNELEKKIHSLC